MKIIKKPIVTENDDLNDYLNCFGYFRLGDRICYNHCALRIKCLIKKELLLSAELIEDFMEAETHASVSQ